MKKGFTTIELIVAVGVFGVVATLAVGSLLILTKAEEKAVNVGVSQDNVRFALEVMAREARTGSNFRSCDSLSPLEGPTDCFLTVRVVSGLGLSAIRYKTSINPSECNVDSSFGPVSCIVKNTKVCAKPAPEGANTTDPKVCADAFVDGSIGIFNSVTAPQIKIDRLKFYIAGTSEYGDNDNDYQARVTIVLQGQTPDNINPLSSNLDVQTTVTQLSVER